MELYCAVVIKHVAFFTILAKLTVVFTSTSFPLNIYTSVFGCDCGFGFEQKFWRIDGFGEKRARIGGFTYPYSPPSRSKISAGRESLRTFNVVFKSPAFSFNLHPASSLYLFNVADCRLLKELKLFLSVVYAMSRRERGNSLS